MKKLLKSEICEFHILFTELINKLKRIKKPNIIVNVYKQ